MAFKTEEEVLPENIEMIGHPVQESSCVKTRPWPSSDKQSHNHPGAADTMGINSKPVFAHDEEMTKTGVEEEGLAVCEMMEEAEGVEEGKMEGKAEEKVAEAELGVLCSFEGMPGSCLSPPENMEAEHQSPTFTAEHEPHLATSITKREPTLTVEHEPHLASPMTKPEPTVTAENGPHLATTMTKPEPTVTAENGPHLATSMTKPEPAVTAENGTHLATTMGKREHRPDGSTAEGHIKVTDRIAGQKKVFRKRQKAKPKMQMAEAAGTEGGPQNTRAPFRLQDFMCFKISKHYTVLLLLVLLAFPVNSNETSKQRMCARCLEKDCANGVRIIYLATGSDTPVWSKASSPTGIQTCSMENLKADAPCKMANGSLAQLADNPLQFEGDDSFGVRRTFHSQILPCDKLNLPHSSKPSPGVPHVAPTSKAPIRNTSPPAATNNSVADNKGIIIVIGIIIVFGICMVICMVISIVIGSIVGIGFLIWKLCNCPRGLYRGRRQGNNGVPPQNAEHPNEITIEMQPLKGEVPNENVNGVH